MLEKLCDMLSVKILRSMEQMYMIQGRFLKMQMQLKTMKSKHTNINPSYDTNKGNENVSLKRLS